MKKTFIILVLLSFFIGAQASIHLKFMGIDIDGDFNDFKISLENKGFVYEDSYKSLHKFYGVFANEVVKLQVLASPKTNIVCKVIVYFPEKNNWAKLKADYFKKKNMYSTKYTIDKDFEFFGSPYDEGDGYEMRAVQNEKCFYNSFFLAIGGHIGVEICKDKCVKVTYEDRENIKIAQKELEETSLDDI